MTTDPAPARRPGQPPDARDDRDARVDPADLVDPHGHEGQDGHDGDDDLAARLRREARSGDVGGAGVDLRDLVARAVARAEADGLVDVAWAVADSPVGPLTLAATPVGIVKISFGEDDDVVDGLAAEVSPRVLHLPARLDEARRQLDEYFAHRRRHFELPLDRRLSRGYRLQVLEALSATVPYGEVATYKDLAVATENPGAVRAVGTAMATNPIPIVVPCHRVVRSGGSLGNYGGGPETKAFLLRLEGAPVLL